jgi:hypothetical protein
MTYTLTELEAVASAIELASSVSEFTGRWEHAFRGHQGHVGEAMVRRTLNHPSGVPTDLRISVVWSSAEWLALRVACRALGPVGVGIEDTKAWSQ